MTFFTASFETVLIRFYLMMTIIIASFSFGFPVLALLALPLFLSALVGLSFKTVNQKVKKQTIETELQELKKIKSAA